jgi:outer membrane protein
MNRKLVLLAALVAGLPLAAAAQASPAVPQPATPAPTPASASPQTPPPVAPTAYPTKIALVDFTGAVTATNEGQQAMLDVQQKYEPKKAQLDQEAAEVATLQKKLQATPATLSEDERAALAKNIDTKDKQYQRDVEDAQTSYQSDVQEALGKIAQKFYPVVTDYVEKNGYTLLINVSESQSTPSSVMWTRRDPNADITEAVIAAYNAVSKVAAPAPSAPSATRPKPATTPQHAAPKPPSQ